MVNTNSNTPLGRQWSPLGFLPNRHDYRFIGLTHEGVEVPGRVVLTPSGTYAVADDLYPKLQAWRPAP